MDCQYLELIKKSFNALWRCKQHGEEIEITSPYLSTDSKFVSLFISKWENEYIVSEGGLLYEAMLESEEYEEKFYKLTLEHYKKFFGVKERVLGKDFKRYYKTTNDINLVPALVFELSQFFSSVCSSLYIVDSSKTDEVEKRFHVTAREFFQENFKGNVVFNKPLIPNYARVRFNAIVQRGKYFHAFTFASGSNRHNFDSSLNKAIVNFEIVRNIRADIGERIGIIHDEAAGFSEEITPRLNVLRHHSTQDPILWREREKILSIVSAN